MGQITFKKETNSPKGSVFKEIFGIGKNWKINAQKVKNELRKNK